VFSAFSLIAILCFLFKGQVHSVLVSRLFHGSGGFFRGEGVLLKLIENNIFSFAVQSIVLLTLFCGTYLFFKKLVSEKLFSILVIVLITAGLYYFNAGLYPGVPTSAFAIHGRTLPYLFKDKGVYRIYVDPEIAEKTMLGYKDHVEMYLSAKELWEPNVLVPYHISGFRGRASIEPFRNMQLYQKHKDDFLNNKLSYLSMANVKYVLSYRQLKWNDLELLSDKLYFLYRNENALPRFYFPDKYKVSQGLVDFDPSKEVLLDSEPKVEINLSKGEIKLLEYKPNHVAIKVKIPSVSKDMNGHAILVFADSFDPGWQAFVDGEKTEIYRANYLFKGILVPAGDHLVKFIYYPKHFRVSLFVSFLTLLGITIYGFRIIKQKN
jgi:uncharacterized membrane protein YfhO